LDIEFINKCLQKKKANVIDTTKGAKASPRKEFRSEYLNAINDRHSKSRSKQLSGKQSTDLAKLNICTKYSLTIK